MEDGRWGVHIEHCCVYHGCKYGDDDCHVVNMLVDQKYPCESCCDNEEKAVEFRKSKEGKELFSRLRLLAVDVTSSQQEQEHQSQRAEDLFDDFLKAVCGQYWK